MPAPAATKLDAPQVLQHSFEESVGALRVIGSVTAAPPPSGITDVIISRENDSIALGTYGPSGSDFTGSSASGGKFALDVFQLNPVSLSGSVSGVFEPTGLRTGLATTSVIVSATAAALPLSALAARNGISLRIWQPSSAVVYIGNSGVTVDNGYPKLWREEIQMDARNATGTILYGVCDAGATAEVRIMEIA